MSSPSRVLRAMEAANQAGKPAVLYALSPAAEPLLSRAYPPVLNAVLDVLATEMPAQAVDLMRRVGERLAASSGGPATGSLQQRVHAAAAVLTSLGGDVEVLEEEGALTIRGCGCPLSAAVAQRPEVCHAVEALVSGVAGARAVSGCEHGERPRCRFRVTAPDA